MDTIINNRYKIIEKIKEKSNCIIYKGFDLKEKKDVAVKVINLKNVSNIKIDKIKNELNTMNKIDSKYSLKCYETFNSLSEMHIILEYCQDNLFDKMKSFVETSKIYYIKKIFNQLMEVYQILHKNNVIIRELKPEKILIKYTNQDETEFDIKLSDYSYSKELSDEEVTHTKIGNSTYIAPEISAGEDYTNKCDLWSIGILGYILYFGEIPFFKTLKNLENDCKIKEDYNLEDLIKKLLKLDPEKRISWEEFFNHNFFKQKNFDKVEKKDFEELLKKYPKLEETF